MLRKILVFLGVLIALLPYLGLPQSIDTIISTVAGVLIVALLLLSRKSRPAEREEEQVPEQNNPNVVEESAYLVTKNDRPKALHIERKEVAETKKMHIEKQVIEDTNRYNETPDTDTIVEKKVTVVRRRKRKPVSELPVEMIENGP